MAELAGNSQAAIVGELLEASLPVFERMVRVLEAAAAVKARTAEERAAMAESIVSDLDHVQARLEGQLGLQLDDLDRRAESLHGMAERSERRRRGMRAAAAPPAPKRPTPLSNRGVTPHPGKGKRR
jgi:hypothetical protein